MTSLKLAKTHAMRTALRQETLKLLQHGDLDTVSVDRLAQQMNVSKATIYNYYPTRDALLEDAARTLYDYQSALFQNGLKQNLPPDEKILACLDALFLFYEQYSNVFRHFEQSWVQASVDIRQELYHLALNAITAELKQGIRDGDFAQSIDPEKCAFSLLSTAQGMIRHIALHETAYTPDECRRILKETTLMPLKVAVCQK